MGGGLMQLVAYGAQDVYLTGNPQITFFKVVYRRHTNFSMESIRQTATGTGDRQTVTVARNGDLVHKVCIESSVTTTSRMSGNKWGQALCKKIHSDEKNKSPSAMIDTIEVEIGGQLIDRIDGRFIQYYGELCDKNPTGSEMSMFQSSILRGRTMESYNNTSWIPLPFWFCRNPGLSIPLIALQYHEVKFNLNYTTGAAGVDKQLYVDYIYLDTDERRRFAQVSHEYLIEQVQHQEHSFTPSQSIGSLNLIFNHPVKELIWVYTDNSNNGNNNEEQVPIKIDCTSQLKLNGQDRFEKMDASYFTRVQPWKYHTGSSLNRINLSVAIPSNNRFTIMSKGPNNDAYFVTDYIHVYSFALKPEEHQPSGTCNFSRIDSAVLKVAGNAPTTSGSVTELDIYAINYNVLRIMSGMGGLAYSN
jgi:hypothetical protein